MKVNCEFSKCIHNECGCQADNIQVRKYDDQVQCNTFQTEDIQKNTAAEHMLGVDQGYIGDGSLTTKFYYSEFGDLTNPINNAKVTCTVGDCIHNKHFVCCSNIISISGTRSKNGNLCQTFRTS